MASKTPVQPITETPQPNLEDLLCEQFAAQIVDDLDMSKIAKLIAGKVSKGLKVKFMNWLLNNQQTFVALNEIDAATNLGDR
jgi:hypothetical protein